MNTFDFDQTIFYPDSSYCFVMFCLRHYTRAVLHALPGTIAVGCAWLLKKAETKELKEQVFSFLPWLPGVEAVVHDFWDEHRKKIAPWYLEQKRADDVIISASPEFLLRPISEELGVRLIATDMEPYTGRIRGRNCHDQEKVRRLRAAFPGETVEAFYSDSLSDTPMAEIAQHAFLVKGNQRIPWPFN